MKYNDIVSYIKQNGGYDLDRACRQDFLDKN